MVGVVIFDVGADSSGARNTGERRVRILVESEQGVVRGVGFQGHHVTQSVAAQRGTSGNGSRCEVDRVDLAVGGDEDGVVIAEGKTRRIGGGGHQCGGSESRGTDHPGPVKRLLRLCASHWHVINHS